MIQIIPLLAAVSFPGGSHVTEQDLVGRYQYIAATGLIRIPVADYEGIASITAGGDSLELIPAASSAGGMTYLLASPAESGGWFLIDTLETGMPLRRQPIALWTFGTAEISLSSADSGSASFATTVWGMTDSGFVVRMEQQEDWSLENLRAVEENLASGYIPGATHSLLCVMYPEQYYEGGEMASEFLLASYLESRRQQGDERIDPAFEIYFDAMEAYVRCGLEPLWFLDVDDLRSQGSPVAGWMSDSLLGEILDQFACVAVQSGHHEYARLAEDAAEALRR